jgi:hypothetical protein
MNKRVLAAVLAAERLGVSTRTIHRWAADGFFPGAYKHSTTLSKTRPLSFQWRMLRHSSKSAENTSRRRLRTNRVFSITSGWNGH